MGDTPQDPARENGDGIADAGRLKRSRAWYTS